MPFQLLNRDDLPSEDGTFDFEGMKFDQTQVSFILVDIPPGRVVKKHQHAYKEIFIVLEGSSTFTVDGQTVDVTAGQIVIVPAKTPHGFYNSGKLRLKQVDIHVSPIIKTEWLED